MNLDKRRFGFYPPLKEAFESAQDTLKEINHGQDAEIHPAAKENAQGSWRVHRSQGSTIVTP